MDQRDTLIDQVIERLAARHGDAQATLDLLRGYAQQVDGAANELENPVAVKDYVQFFVQYVTRTADECARISAELTTEGVRGEHVMTLKRLASDSIGEQRRCLLFRDKWINKPLPYEKQRPMLNDISVTTRDQLTAFRDLTSAAEQLERFLIPQAPPAPPERTFDRRALFTRFIKRD